MSEREIDLKFVVNGQSVPVNADLGWEFREAAEKALEESGNSGQPIENWEIRDGSGQVIDMGTKIAQSGIKEEATLFLNLKAGVGGSCAR